MPELTQDLKGKTALVTGSTSGIGLAIAQEFLARGAQVMFTGVFFDNQEKTAEAQRQEFHEKIRACQAQYPGQNIGLQEADVSTPESVQKLVDAAAILGGGTLDILVNNAGMQIPKPVGEISPAEWKKLIDVNLNGAFYAMNAAVPYMKKAGGGTIINITSVHAHVVSPGRAAYCASKFGLRALTEAAAIDLAPHRIAVNTVSPAFVKTPLAEIQIIDRMKHLGESREDAEAWRLQLQDGKWIESEDLAARAADLCAGTLIIPTGSDLLMDYGYVAHAREHSKSLSITGIAFFDKASREAVEAFNAARQVNEA
jgi:3-hydroxybutyrate dehydrogenase